jgi:hypothetical protein
MKYPSLISRPSGTLVMFTVLFPGNKLLGYFRLSLTGQK